MQQLLHPVSAILASAGFLLLLWPPRHLRKDRSLAALAGVYGFCALSFLVSLEPVWVLLGDSTGLPAIGILAAFTTVTVQVSLQPVALAYWVLPPGKAAQRARLCLGAGAVAILGLVVLFLQLPPAGRTTPQTITAQYIRFGAYQAYLSLYIVTYTVGQTALAVGCWTAARRTDQAWVARGLRLVGAGAVLTLGYSAIRLAGIATRLFDQHPLPPAVEGLAWICADGGNTLVLIGFFIPTLAVHVVPRVRTWTRAQRDYRRLAPLWEAVHRTVPGVALQPARTAARLYVWDPAWHLYRRTVEIRDGQWALRHHLDESVRSSAERHHRAAGLTGAELASAVTADQLRAALGAYRRDEPPRTPAEYADAGTRELVRTPDDDVRQLLRIAAHYDTSPTRQEVATPGS